MSQSWIPVFAPTSMSSEERERESVCVWKRMFRIRAGTRSNRKVLTMSCQRGNLGDVSWCKVIRFSWCWRCRIEEEIHRRKSCAVADAPGLDMEMRDRAIASFGIMNSNSPHAARAVRALECGSGADEIFDVSLMCDV